MSRIGKRPVAIPSGVTAAIEGNTLSVKGPKGTLTLGLSDEIAYAVEDGQISVKPANDGKVARAYWGMQRTLVSNLVEGVSAGFTKVLVIKGDAYLIDFEGEPAATADQRHGRASPYRDVAGMLRSFDYAAATLSRADPLGGAPTDFVAGAVDADGHATASHERREALLERFRQSAGQAFLSGYREAAVSLQAPEGAERDLLRLAQIQKAAYEVRYEVLHRPTWISIPLCALGELCRSALLDAAIDEERQP